METRRQLSAAAVSLRGFGKDGGRISCGRSWDALSLFLFLIRLPIFRYQFRFFLRLRAGMNLASGIIGLGVFCQRRWWLLERVKHKHRPPTGIGRPVTGGEEYVIAVFSSLS